MHCPGYRPLSRRGTDRPVSNRWQAPSHLPYLLTILITKPTRFRFNYRGTLDLISYPLAHLNRQARSSIPDMIHSGTEEHGT